MLCVVAQEVRAKWPADPSRVTRMSLVEESGVVCCCSGGEGQVAG